METVYPSVVCHHQPPLFWLIGCWISWSPHGCVQRETQRCLDSTEAVLFTEGQPYSRVTATMFSVPRDLAFASKGKTEERMETPFILADQANSFLRLCTDRLQMEFLSGNNPLSFSK